MTTTPEVDRTSVGVTLIEIVLILATAGTWVALATGWLGSNLSIEGTPPVEPAAVSRYQLDAVLAIALPAVGIFIAAFSGSRGFVIAQVLLLLVMAVSAWVFAIPTIHFAN